MFIKNKKNFAVYLLLILVSFLLVLINTALSPLYDTSYITHDASVFYVIGRGMKNGLLPYKDLFDHKGLYVYFLYYIASLIGEKYQIGLYIVFSILVSVFSVTTYKIIRLFNIKNFISIFSTIFLSILSVSMFYSHGALLCEYIALTTITISIYFATLSIMKDDFDVKYMFIHGILCAINIFCKANYTLYFFAFSLFAFYKLVFIKKDVKLLFKNILSGIIGLFIGAMPVLIYCIVNNILSEMIFATFTFNFKYVADLNVDLPQEVTSSFEAFVLCLKAYLPTIIIAIISFVILIFYNKNIDIEKKKYSDFLIFYFMTFISLAISVFLALSIYTHYLTVLIPYLVPFIILIFTVLDKIYNVSKFKRIVMITFITVSLGMLSYYFGGYYLRVNFDTTSRQHAQIKKVIKKYVRLDKNADILCCGLGSSIYNYLGVLPKEKYFYMPGISYKMFPQCADSVWENVKNFKSKVVYYGTNKMVVDNLGSVIIDFLDKNYVKVLDISEYKKLYIRKDIFEMVENE